MRKHYGYADFFLNSDVSQRACKRAGKVTVQNDKIRVLLIALSRSNIFFSLVESGFFDLGFQTALPSSFEIH